MTERHDDKQYRYIADSLTRVGNDYAEQNDPDKAWYFRKAAEAINDLLARCAPSAIEPRVAELEQAVREARGIFTREFGERFPEEAPDGLLAWHLKTDKMLASAEGHKWDRDGERCEKCGAKDWMGGPCTPRSSTGRREEGPADTPRTNAEEYAASSGEFARVWCVDSDFARKLERELNAARSATRRNFRLVPEQPTEAMIEAGVKDTQPYISHADAEEIYKAMLRFAPSTPSVAPSPDDKAIELARAFLSGKVDVFFSHDAGHLSREILRISDGTATDKESTKDVKRG